MFAVMRPVQIVGGGVAGLTLGILLCREKVPVRLWEAGNYPRHRVCGEFVSGTGAELLLRLLDGADFPFTQARTVRFFTDSRSSPLIDLPSAGLSISRYELDRRLADLFVGAGGELLAGQRWCDSFDRAGLVRASGRLPGKSAKGWTGLKVHARGMNLLAELEMHFSDAGYVGISLLPDGVNVCALMRPGCDLSMFRSSPGAFFASMAPQVADRVRDAEFDQSSLSATSGISFGSRASAAPTECRIGDAFRVIPPFTGNGMSLGVESAFLAAPLLVRYSRGDAAWPEVVRCISEKCERQFQKRFLAASAFRALADRSWTRALMLSGINTTPVFLKMCFQLTR